LIVVAIMMERERIIVVAVRAVLSSSSSFFFPTNVGWFVVARNDRTATMKLKSFSSSTHPGVRAERRHDVLVIMHGARRRVQFAFGIYLKCDRILFLAFVFMLLRETMFVCGGWLIMAIHHKSGPLLDTAKQ
jgi:hypothetical protein